MIVDTLAARADGIREFCRDAHIIRVPFPVLPSKDGVPYFRVDMIPRGLKPRSGDLLSARWANPPFRRTVIVSQNDEPGALFIQADPIDECPPESIRGNGWSGVGARYYVGINAVWTPSDDADGIAATRSICALGEFTYQGAVETVASRVVAGEMDPGDQEVRRLVRGHWARARWLGHQLIDDGMGMTEALRETAEPMDVLADCRAIATQAHYASSITVVTFSLLNCRNVVSIDVEPSPALTRNRLRKGKAPLYRYHELRVTPFKPRRTRNADHPTGGEPVAIHFVRGHFKEYTAERPLFGRLVGLWWWQPHLAGRAKRIVDKDYRIEAGGTGHVENN